MLVSDNSAGVQVACTDDFDYLMKKLPGEFAFYKETRPENTPFSVTIQKRGDGFSADRRTLDFTFATPIKEIMTRTQTVADDLSKTKKKAPLQTRREWAQE